MYKIHEYCCFLLQHGGLTIELGVKVHMDTLGTNGGPQGAPKIAQKSLKNGFYRGKMKKLEQNSSLRFILKLVLLRIHETRGMTLYEAVEKNLGLDEQKHAVFKDINLINTQTS